MFAKLGVLIDGAGERHGIDGHASKLVREGSHLHEIATCRWIAKSENHWVLLHEYRVF